MDLMANDIALQLRIVLDDFIIPLQARRDNALDEVGNLAAKRSVGHREIAVLRELAATVASPTAIDLRFDIANLLVVSPYCGSSRAKRPVGMPRIPQLLLKTTFFLYQSAADAHAGVNAGASGFICFVPSATSPRHGLFVGVTNYHAAIRSGHSVARIPRKDGSCEVFEFGPEDWIFEPGGDDVAIIPLSINTLHHDFSAVRIDLFATEDWIRTQEVGVGDDVFMFGLFLDAANHAVSIPTARFGHISMMPSEATRIKQAQNCMRPSLVLDMHSRDGFSGSPVFMYRTSGSNLDHANTTNTVFGEGTIFCLIGLHWGQFPEIWKSVAGDVTGVSGLTLAVPSWRLARMIRENESLGRHFARIEAAIAGSLHQQSTPEAD